MEITTEEKERKTTARVSPAPEEKKNAGQNEKEESEEESEEDLWGMTSDVDDTDEDD